MPQPRSPTPRAEAYGSRSRLSPSVTRLALNRVTEFKSMWRCVSTDVAPILGAGAGVPAETMARQPTGAGWLSRRRELPMGKT